MMDNSLNDHAIYLPPSSLCISHPSVHVQSHLDSLASYARLVHTLPLPTTRGDAPTIEDHALGLDLQHNSLNAGIDTHRLLLHTRGRS
jgi:hypothetical protein